ncbi:DUF6925 family protein [Hansschlegelia plantiphila]|uniref:Uncharacterized protein n=1 Tax=Hansschlegelia plantiphila TaxID=374655 RepID=A0A9W6IZ63_9HYPH|nr:hypothetical protein [Hansschlegelia plantiphila]GLK66783.1 hypothetical protein GCM10008179_04210 [Hansschlegelia plantiphila]
MNEVAAALEAQIRSAETHWHLGSFGVVAEFMRDVDEPAAFPGDRGLAAFTARGAMRLEPMQDLTLFAYETAMSRAATWSQRVALCLPHEACHMNRRRVVTELGLDLAAVRADDRRAILFDLGLDRLQVDACVRTSDVRLIDALRKSEGRSLFDVSNGAMMAVMTASPHRVFVARFGRVEVFQPIPAPGGESPRGPHTHVLPKLMRTGRTHAADAPIPKGLTPCGGFAPPHPLRDARGRPTPFDPARHAAFQAMLDRFGDGRLVSVKRAAAYEEHGAGLKPLTRHERAAARVGALQRGLPA